MDLVESVVERMGMPLVRLNHHAIECIEISFFAEFETARQHFIRAFHIRKPRRAEAFVNRARDRGHIPKATSDAVRVVRGNVLVHERSTPVNPVTIREATRFVCTFLSRLQRIW
jgi:hypothetical protein